MQLTTTLLPTLLLSLTTASPTLQKRTPSDQSGNSIMNFGCEGVTVPGDVNGGPDGVSYFSSHLTFQDGSGAKVTPDCTTDPKDGNGANCTLESDFLKESINVHTEWYAIAGQSGCNIVFDYDGKHYDSSDKQPECGHTGGGFQPFSSSVNAICFFDMCTEKCKP